MSFAPTQTIRPGATGALPTFLVALVLAVLVLGGAAHVLAIATLF